MRRFLNRGFDWVYLAVIPAVVLTYFVPLRMRVGNTMVIPFVVLWLILAFLRSTTIPVRLTRMFLNFFLPLGIFFVMRSVVAGWHEYSGVPLARYFQYSGLILFYVYLFHYTVTRHKYKELLILNAIILICLGYGCFSSLNFELGTGRQVIENAIIDSYELTMDRLEYAAAGGTNFGDAYAMVFISIAFLVYLLRQTWRWKVFYFAIICVYFMGIYRASFSTGLAILLFMACLAIFDRSRTRSMRFAKIALPIISIVFVTIVAYPRVLAPFAGLTSDLGVAVEPISKDYSLRLISVSEAMSGYKDTYAVMRAELYWNSLEIFLQNPIFGYRWDQIIFGVKYNFGVKGHSYLFDTLAMSGIMMGSVLVIAIINYFRYLKYVYEISGLSSSMLKSTYYSFWALAIVASINQVDSFNIFVAFFFVVPSIPFFNYQHNVMQNLPCGYQRGGFPFR